MRQVPQILLCFILFFTSAIQAHIKPRTLALDFPDMEIGIADNPAGPTGVTLFYFPKGAQAAVDIRGGSVGTFFTQEKMNQGEAQIDGILLCGGGILGLEAVSGVISNIFEQRKQNDFNQMPLITGGVIFDYTPRKNFVYPDHELGKKAYQQRKTNHFLLGQHGVGASATVGKLFGEHHLAGQGGAYAQWGETKIAVFTVLNAMGVILDEKGNIVHGTKTKQTLSELINLSGQKLAQIGPIGFNNPSNTTLTVVVTNEKLSPRHLQQLGRSVHHALSQVIYPYATILDGDLVYTVSTQSRISDLYQPGSEIDKDLNLKMIYLSTVAGQLAKTAVWNAIDYKAS
jgi:L-aminopeptidase/D-esterase-like protein